MKPLYIKLLAAGLLLMLVLPACSSSQDPASDAVNWQPYSEGLQAAAAQNKKSFLYFRADW